VSESIEIRNDEKGEFDELVAASASVHIEMMSDKSVWIGIEDGGQSYAVWISSKKKLAVHVEDQSPA
jgi:hypothetical protein